MSMSANAPGRVCLAWPTTWLVMRQIARQAPKMSLLILQVLPKGAALIIVSKYSQKTADNRYIPVWDILADTPLAEE